ncbi:hypothetical protein Taro_020211 [Colocasia esculenta]|uniref:Long-chain-alcohol oxidase n=1 Tax=Colocasia esculenta TaxID=4460 RepID=A0A843V4J3_COLES|nr:hypothetical protein [Colocasia esculenta]
MSTATGELGEGYAAATEVSRLAALLRGGRPLYPIRLSPAQMDSLKAFCDTLLPSLDISASATVSADEALVKFYCTSASMAGVPEELGGLLSGRLQHPAMGLLRLSLWMLSTWYGTLAICGRASLSKSFPYVHKFSEVEQAKREDILTALSSSSFFLYSMLYRSLKFLTMRLYFQKADENNDNHSWKAIGYCGPDPNLPVLCKARKEETDKAQPQVGLMGPLNRAIVDMSGPNLLPALHTLNSLGFASVHTTFTTSRLTIHCDAVVVGSGSGGAVVAGILAKAGFRVVVLDKGRYFPTAALSLLEGPSTEQMYESGGLVATDDVGAFVLAGSTVGGGSVVNWSACIRTPDHVLNEWCHRHELKLFGGQAFRDALNAVCARMNVRPSGAAGKAEEGLNSAVLRRGCSQLGYPVTDVPVNAAPRHDCGWCHLGCKDGKKKSTTETWLADLANSGNGVILGGCRTLKVVTKEVGGSGGTRKVATGVVAELEHGVLVVESKVTVVACGSLNTPALLRRSGLRNPNIGRHLRLHPTVTAWGYFPENPETNTWLEPDKRCYSGGILTSMSTMPSDSGYGAIIQTPAMHPGMFSAMTPWTSAADFRGRMLRFSRTATLFTLARDRGSGCSTKYPSSLAYKLDAGDEANLQRGMERMLRILAAAGAEELGTHHRGGEVFRLRGSTLEEFEAYVKRASSRPVRDLSTPISSAHQMGSCRMGVNPQSSAVNPNGETWEVERLFVTDTSVFPTALGVNPMVTVQAIAYCTAQNVLETLNKKSD